MMAPQTVFNSKGDPIVLNAKEQRIAEYNQRIVNALGFEINITTLTTIIKKITEQKFFEIAPADYLPVRVGEGAWSSNLVTYRTFNVADDFETGVLNTGSNSSRLAAADAAIDSLPIKVLNWGKTVGWSIMDLEMAAKASNWDLVTAKEKARKKNWDLGIQKIAFLGSASDSAVLGLLNQSGVTYNTSVITGAISAMSPSSLQAFLAQLLAAYRVNCNHTAWPTHFIIPESDYLGLAAPSSATFPLNSYLELLEKALKTMTHNPNFKVLPLAYADNSISGFGYQQYALLNYEEESIRMDIPVDYTTTLANSIDNFMFQNVGYGQFTGVLAYRPQELLYFKY